MSTDDYQSDHDVDWHPMPDAGGDVVGLGVCSACLRWTVLFVPVSAVGEPVCRLCLRSPNP